ncbi:MAG: N-acetylmuramoyl-L-alanine amidase [Clostridia bacterium]|nr:N-acetylmuramoyl-L-alanine amidase [Clostridia bacterium]
MKKVLALLLALLSFWQSAAAMTLVYNGGEHEYDGYNYKLIVNGNIINPPLQPIIFNNRALVPVREVFEAMGANVNYHWKTKEITIQKGETYIEMQIDSPYIMINGDKTTIHDGVTPMLIAKKGDINSKTMVPVRIVSENLRMDVVYDADKKEIRITDPELFESESDRPTITKLSAKESGNDIVIKITADKSIEKVSELTYVGSSKVLFLDLFDTDHKLSSNYEINKNCVSQIRVGEHNDYTRIAIDTSGPDSYKRTVSADKKTVTVTVSGKGSGTPEKPTTTPTGSVEPTKSPTPTKTPTPTFRPDYYDDDDKIVIIDAGHGGYDPGAVYTHDGVDYEEKAINLAVAKKVVQILKENGVNVEMTRTGDTYPTLSDRYRYANDLNASLFVSLHSNASDVNAEANGIEVYYSSTNNSTDYTVTSKELATEVYKNLIKNTGATQRGVKTEQHAVTRNCKMPAILIEMGFISNSEEALKMSDSDYQDLIAEAIADAIISKIDKTTFPSPTPTSEE